MPTSSLRGARGRRFKSEINVVPYIDVMLVLLVIFMVAAPLTTPGVINLPTAAKSSLPPSSYIVVSLKADTTSTIGIASGSAGSVKPVKASGRTDLMRRLEALHKENPELPLMVSADRDIKYDEVIRMISAAKQLGIDRVGLSTKTESR